MALLTRRTGFVSSLRPGCRLLCLVLVSTACFFMPASLAIGSAALLAFLVLREGLEASRLARESAFILWLSAFSVLLQGLDFEGGLSLDREGLGAAFEYSARLFAAFYAGRLFYAATPRRELREAASAATWFLPSRMRGALGMALSLILGYLPLVAEEWRYSLEAARARGLAKRPGLRRSSAIVAAYLRRLMLASLALPEALEARGWRADTSARPRAWQARDWFASGLSLCSLAIAILCIV